MALYNQTIKTATTSSPYFTEQVIDSACFNCANGIGTTTDCDICQTYTNTIIKTYNYFDLIIIILIVMTLFKVINFFVKKLK